MNEGKPVPTDGAETAAPEERDGYRAESPSGEAGGDYELSGPVSVPAHGENAADGDFVLERPTPTPSEHATEAKPSAAGPTAPDGTDGESDLRQAEPVDSEGTGPAGSGCADAAGSAQAGPAGPVGAKPTGSASTGPAAGSDGSGGNEPVVSGHPHPGGDVHAATADRPRPLHDPDAYSTPPYGQPGPWAPAPPVQHPAMTTPAAGTALPSHGPHDPSAPTPPVPAHDAMAPGMATVPGTAPAPGTRPAPPAGAQVPGTVPVPSGDVPSETGPALPAPEPGAAFLPGTAPRTSDPWQNYDPWASRAPLQQNGAPVAGHDRRRGRSRMALVLGAALTALLAGGAVGALLERDTGAGNVQLPQAGAEPVRRSPNSIAGIAARALPGVVTLHVKGADGEGTGTGFVLDGQGHILTNNHVVEAAGPDGRITATFDSGETATATVVGRDTGYDLAVVKVNGVRGLNPLPLGNSDNVQVGDPVVAIGAPFDLAGTVTSGIISAKERPVTAGGEKGDGSDVSYVDALQTDAPINPGNSGGPLLDARGRVVGINSAIRSADSGSGEGGEPGSIGLGFAIPVNQAKRVAEELINTGRATHPVIGVTLDMKYSGDGARVGAKGSVAGGPGDRAGIRPGDIVTAIDGVRVHSGQELIVRTRAHRPGDRLRLRVVRDGAQRTITLVLGSAGGG